MTRRKGVGKKRSLEDTVSEPIAKRLRSGPPEPQTSRHQKIKHPVRAYQPGTRMTRKQRNQPVLAKEDAKINYRALPNHQVIEISDIQSSQLQKRVRNAIDLDNNLDVKQAVLQIADHHRAENKHDYTVKRAHNHMYAYMTQYIQDRLQRGLSYEVKSVHDEPFDIEARCAEKAQELMHHGELGMLSHLGPSTFDHYSSLAKKVKQQIQHTVTTHPELSAISVLVAIHLLRPIFRDKTKEVLLNFIKSPLLREFESAMSINTRAKPASNNVSASDRKLGERTPASLPLARQADRSGGEVNVESHPAGASLADIEQHSIGSRDREAGEIASSDEDGGMEPSNVIQLWQLAPEEQLLQDRYFSITEPSARVQCLACGRKGHMAKSCSLKGCKACDTAEHSRAYCPKGRKCSHCRQRGHDQESCTYTSVVAGGVGDECDFCGKFGHAEEECHRLWSSFEPVPWMPKMNPGEMRVFCYNCGHRGHWGDDCPTLSSYIVGRVNLCSTFSKERAKLFIVDDAADIDQVSRSGHENTSGSLPSYQLQQLGNFV